MDYLATLLSLLTVIRLSAVNFPNTFSHFIKLNLNISDIKVQPITVDHLAVMLIGSQRTIVEFSINDDAAFLRKTFDWMVTQDDKYPMLDSMLELSCSKVTILLQILEAMHAWNILLFDHLYVMLYIWNSLFKLWLEFEINYDHVLSYIWYILWSEDKCLYIQGDPE